MTLPATDQSVTLGTGIASEQSHWYQRETGVAVYEVPMTSKEGMRRTNLKDARKLDLVPSVTSVLKVMAAPGLEIWKAQQLLQAALTLPKKQGETLDAYSERVVEDSKAQGIEAASRGKQLHAAIEKAIQGEDFDIRWREHVEKVISTLAQHGIDLFAGSAEHTFATQIDGNWYGGKMDFHVRNGERVLCDFKSKDEIVPKKQLVWDEHPMQIGSYGYGIFGVVTTNKAWKWEAFRGLNVFVGVNDCEIRVHEHTPEDLAHGFELFRSILDFWTRKNRFGKYSIK